MTKENQEGLTLPSRRDHLIKAKESPVTPGVYLMKDGSGVVLYVGKAKNLKNRVTTYFQPAPNISLRTEMMVDRVHNFEVILTETETEALILEATLIKKHRPSFNVRLKDDKAYPYIRVSINESFPRLEFTRKVKKDDARYFGPFPSAGAARSVLRLLTETFRLRDCSENTFKHRSRPCLLFQIQKCSAPCVGKIEETKYKEDLDEATSVLSGGGEKLLTSLRRGMEDAAEKQEYEQAADYRDQIENIELVTQTQGVLEAGVERFRDVVGICREKIDLKAEGPQGTLARGALIQIRGGRVIGVKHYQIENSDPEMSQSEVLYAFLTQYYIVAKEEVPAEVMVPESPKEPEVLELAIGTKIRVPESKEESQLINVARANAEHALEIAKRKGFTHGAGALEEVQKKLGLEKLPYRIECYDISNIQGSYPVASRVVFVDGSPDKNLYRRYKIKTVEGQNDFAMMKEVLGRRFDPVNVKGKKDHLPQLVLVDGGKGQLAQAIAIIDELNIQGVAVASLAKARTESDFKSKEVKTSPERVFIPNRKNPIVLKPNTSIFRLLTHLRNEAHRFAISYHRLLRGKAQKK